MIIGALFSLVTLVLDALTALLPSGSLGLPSPTAIGTWVGEYAGPLDQFIPLHESFTYLSIVVTIWFPAVIVYTTVKWIYKHMPVIGKG